MNSQIVYLYMRQTRRWSGIDVGSQFIRHPAACVCVCACARLHLLYKVDTDSSPAPLQMAHSPQALQIPEQDFEWIKVVAFFDCTC